MKKTALILIMSAVTIFTVNSQNIDDAVRYSQTFYNGSARFISMGGAFTSLGADLSAISLNPAGAGMFRSFEVSLSPQLVYNNNSSVFNAMNSTGFRYSFGLSQAGVVANVFSSGNSSGLISINAAYSYNRSANFNEEKLVTGISNNTSMADYWAISSDGVRFNNLTGAAGLAYDTWLIDTLANSDARSYGTIFSNYGGNTNSTYGQTIRRIIKNQGYIGEHSFSVGANFSDKFFVGATLGINSLRYQGHYEHFETDKANAIPDFANFVYTDHFEANGTGYSLNLGAIVRPVEMLRIGFAFHSPVIYRIREYFYDNMTSEFDTPDSDGNYSYEASNDAYRYSYTFTTPMRVLAGVSVQLKKLAILTADYEFVDYRMARFSNASDNYDYQNENESIQNILKTASNIRLGAEFRLGSTYLRGGYGIYGSAFTKGEVNENLNYNSISFGVGFRQQNMYFDLGFANLTSTSKYFMYDDPPYLNPATFTNSRNTFTATIGFKF